MDWSAAKVSLSLAFFTCLLLLPIGITLGRWLAVTEVRWRPAVEACLLLPLLLPPTVLGFYWLNIWGKSTPLGAWVEATFGASLVFSFQGLLLASVLINLPFMVQPIQRAFESVDHAVREAAWVGGLSTARTFFKIELPLALSGIVAGCAMTFAHTLGEFGVVLLVGGNIEGSTRTLSIAIYDKVQSFDFSSAHAMALTLVAFALLALIAIFVFPTRQRWKRLPRKNL
jgi:molybdate transport system permease protein